MVCPKCGSENISVQMVTETKLTMKRRGVLWWLLIGWWWVPVKWLVFTVPALILKLFRPRRYQLRQAQRAVCVCQHCAFRWNA